MKLIPCAPPRGPLNAAPLTDLVTPVMRQLESWDAFWGDDDVYYARLRASDDSARWFRVGPEAGTPAYGMTAIGERTDALEVRASDVLTPPTRTSVGRGVVLYARVTRASAGGHARLAWSVATRGARGVRPPVAATLASDEQR